MACTFAWQSCLLQVGLSRLTHARVRRLISFLFMCGLLLGVPIYSALTYAFRRWVAQVAHSKRVVIGSTAQDAEQIVGRERRERELIADFQLPIVDLNSRRRVNSTVRRHFVEVIMKQILCWSFLFLLLTPVLAQQKQNPMEHIHGVGHVHMDVSCSPSVSADFDFALRCYTIFGSHARWKPSKKSFKLTRNARWPTGVRR